MAALNEHLTRELGQDYTVGHSFLLSPSYQSLDDTDCRRLWENELGPLLEEYFFGQPERVTAAHQVWQSGLIAYHA